MEPRSSFALPTGSECPTARASRRPSSRRQDAERTGQTSQFPERHCHPQVNCSPSPGCSPALHAGATVLIETDRDPLVREMAEPTDRNRAIAEHVHLHSRIVPWFDTGTVITTPMRQVDVIVSEYGAAELQGLTVRQRGKALAAITRPAFREIRWDAAQRASGGRSPVPRTMPGASSVEKPARGTA